MCSRLLFDQQDGPIGWSDTPRSVDHIVPGLSGRFDRFQVNIEFVERSAVIERNLCCSAKHAGS